MRRAEPLDELLAKALLRPEGDEREAWIRDLGFDAVHANELRELIAAHESVGAFLATPLVEARAGAASPAELAEGPGTLIGHYRLVRLLGRGGFGEVYLAEQEEPVRREVAFKILQLGRDTRQVVARFEAERQALALMDHPNIAHVFDAGATATGRPFFVMEVVRGEPITSYCYRHGLSIRARLELFADVCRAVQHAHQKGIIHRDLKPSNVLVAPSDGGAPATPKVIDFGIAKAIHPPLGERRLTEARQLVGTPAYMSPEQAEGGAAVDTQSDVYSLGVLLYELLTGMTPFDGARLREANDSEVQRILREEEPPLPSARLATLGDPDTKILRGDLDWIVMRCLAKEKDRRYPTAIGLGEDVERHLNLEPVQAGPPSATYRVAKFVRRNWTLVTMGAVIAAACLVTTVVSVRWARIARGAEQIADANAREAIAEAEKFRRVEQYLGRLLNSVVNQRIAQGLDPKITRGLLEGMSRRVDRELSEQPTVEAALRNVLGTAYTALADFDAAELHLTQAIALLRRERGDDHPETLAALADLGALRLEQGRLEEAEEQLRDLLDARRAVLGDHHPNTHFSAYLLGCALERMGRLQEAEEILRAASVGLTRILGEEDPYSIAARSRLGAVLLYLGRAAEAEPHLRAAVAGFRKDRGDEHPDTLGAIGNLGAALREQGRVDEAEAHYLEAVTGLRRVLGDDHPLSLTFMSNLGHLLLDRGKPEEAEVRFRETLEGLCRVVGEDDPDTLLIRSNLGVALRGQGRLEEAEGEFRTSLRGFRASLGDDHPHTLVAMHNLASALEDQGRGAEAEELYRASLAGKRDALGDPHPWTLVTLDRLTALLANQGRYEEAEAELLASWEALSLLPDAPEASRRQLQELLVRHYRAADRPEKAAQWQERLEGQAEASGQAPADGGPSRPSR